VTSGPDSLRSAGGGGGVLLWSKGSFLQFILDPDPTFISVLDPTKSLVSMGNLTPDPEHWFSYYHVSPLY
jgi:hypothetical protein